MVVIQSSSGNVDSQKWVLWPRFPKTSVVILWWCGELYSQNWFTGLVLGWPCAVGRTVKTRYGLLGDVNSKNWSGDFR